MKRREFIAAGAGGVAVLGGLRVVFGGGSSDGPEYGSVPLPSTTASTTLANGLTAPVYEDGAIAVLNAALVSQYSGVPALVGRLRNVSDAPLASVRIMVQFHDASDGMLAQGWVGKNDLAAGGVWRFVVPAPREDSDRLASAAIPAIDAH